MDNDGNYKELVYTPGNGVRICYKDYFSSIIVDGKEMINDPSEPLVVDTLIDPVVKVKFKKGITSLLNCFQRCRSLTSIPGDLFSDNPEIGSFYQCFQNCTGLTFIPEDLFRYNTEIGSFSNCFEGCELTSIPKNLFRYNTKVNSFSGCFNGCELTSIPKDLFRYNPEVTEFRYCFSTNNGLTSIPEDLFMYNPKVTSFTYCFYGCGKLKTMPIDSDGTPIYNRSNLGKPGYSIVNDFGNCFYNCRSIEGYDSIPSGWK